MLLVKVSSGLQRRHGTNRSPDKLAQSILACLQLEDLLLEAATVSFGLLLDETRNAEPAVLDELEGQGTGAPTCTVVMLVDDVVDENHV